MQKSSIILLLLLVLTWISGGTSSAQILAQDNFDTYTTGAINGQTGKTIDQTGGDVIGFGSVPLNTATKWGRSPATANGAATVGPAGFVETTNVGRISRAFASTVQTQATADGIVWVAFNAEIGTGYSAIELDNTGNSTGNSAIRLFDSGGSFGLGTTTTTGVITSTNFGSYNAGFNTFLLEVNFTNNTVKAWENPSLTAFDPLTAPNASSAVSFAGDDFSLKYLTTADFFTGSAADLTFFRIADSADTALNAPEPGTWALLAGGLGLLVALRRMRVRA